MGFWNSIKLTGFSGLPMIPKVGNPMDNESQRQQQNQNIFDTLLNQTPKDTFEKSPKRINDLDSNILNQNMVQFLPSDSLRIELQLEKAEKNLKDVSHEINSVRLLGLDKDNDKLAKLEEKKQLINGEIQGYRAQYRELGFVYKIADFFSDLYEKTKDKLGEAKKAVIENPLTVKVKNLIPGFEKNEEMRKILERFNAFKLNMDKIASTKVNPFGETEQYFKDFTALMSKANKIDFQTNIFMTPIIETKPGIHEYAQKAYAKIEEASKIVYSKTVEFLKSLKDDIFPESKN